MDQERFRDWFSRADELTAAQRKKGLWTNRVALRAIRGQHHLNGRRSGAAGKTVREMNER